jgi:hypothetical protein
MRGDNGAHFLSTLTNPLPCPLASPWIFSKDEAAELQRQPIATRQQVFAVK